MSRAGLVTVVSACLGASCGDVTAAGVLKVNGSTTVHPVVAEAADVLRAEKELRIRLDVQGGSSGGISQLGEGLVDVGMASKPVSDEDRARFPACDFHMTRIGSDGVALAVSRAVYDGGVRAITRAEAVGLFEGRIRNWAELGGPDLPVFVYDKEPGRGTREVFESWAYGAAGAPAVSFERYAQVGGNEEGATKTAAHGSAITLLSVAWVERSDDLAALAIREGDRVVEATAESVATGAYPVCRDLFVLTDGAPAGDARTLVEFLLGERGQAIVERHGFQPVAARR